MRRTLVPLISIVILVAIGFALGRFLPSGDSDSAAQQSVAPKIVTVPILITATPDPNLTPQVTIVTATPPPGSIGALPTDLIENETPDGSQSVAPTLDPAVVGEDSVLQATASALPANCTLHVMEEGDTPFGVAEIYDADPFDLLDINGLNDETSRFLDIGDVLIVPLAGCPLTAVQVAAVTGDDEAATPTAEGSDDASEATAEATDEALPTIEPTITLPPTAVNAQVEIVRVIGAGDITAEGIEIRNTGGVVELTGWTLTDAEGNVFTFPEQRLFTNGLVTIYTRRGTNTPIALYWGRSEAVWGEPGDTVTLADDDGDVQAALRLDAPVDLSGS